MCELLVTHPYFNFSQNIAQAVVLFLNNPNKEVRIIVKDTIMTVFKEDKKEEITLKVHIGLSRKYFWLFTMTLGRFFNVRVGTGSGLQSKY